MAQKVVRSGSQLNNQQPFLPECWALGIDLYNYGLVVHKPDARLEHDALVPYTESSDHRLGGCKTMVAGGRSVVRAAKCPAVIFLLESPSSVSEKNLMCLHAARPPVAPALGPSAARTAPAL